MSARNNIRILASILLFVSCSKDRNGIEPVLPPADPGIEATLTLEVPSGGFNVTTKALNDNDEHKVTEVDVLVFKKDAANNETFAYKATTTLINGTAANKSFKANVTPDTDNDQQLVVFANAGSIIGSLNFTGKTKAQALELIEITRSTAWKSTDGSYDPLPMWGETDYKRITDINSIPGSVVLLRSLARIDVKVATSAQGNFKLSEVHLYNASGKGRLAPIPANWNSTPQTPSQPKDGWAKNNNPIPYTTLTTAEKALERTIYTFEAPVTGSNTDAAAACLVVKGSWNNMPASYYRIDFYNETESRYLSLLRNHLYSVEITDVSGIGYSSASEALSSGFTNLQAVTHIWNEGKVGSMVWDGRYYLGVGTTEVAVYPEAQMQTIEVTTNYTDGTTGWKAVVTTDPADEAGWLTIENGTETGAGDGQPHPLKLSIKQNGDGDRTGTVTITAGRLEQTITVTQQITKQLHLEVGDVEVVFSAATPVSQQLRIEWEPASVPCTWELLPVSGYNPVLFTGANTLPINITDEDGNPANGGARNFVFKPDASTLGLFVENRSTLRITAHNDDNSDTESYDVLLRQFDYSFSVSGEQAGQSYQPETTYSLNIKSNTLWEASVSDASLLTITSTVKGEANWNTGEVLIFKTTDDYAKSGQTAYITLKSKETGLIPDKTIIIRLQTIEPNCYIVPASSTTFQFPIRKVFQAWSSDRDLIPAASGINLSDNTLKMSASLLWQDSRNMVTNVTLPSTYNQNAKITVTKNAGWVGNAVIAIHLGPNGNETDPIRWSWHLWVTNYQPSASNTFTYNGLTIMDRNLGATNNQPPTDIDDVRSYGLFYQHSRKDPFPGTATAYVGSSATKPIYKYGNTPLVVNSATGFRKVEVTLPKNLVNAIATPLTFYYKPSTIYNDNDWYTANEDGLNATSRRLDLWPHDYKYYFDPCPEGWRVPKPAQVWDRIIPTDMVTLNYGLMTDTGYYPATGMYSGLNGSAQHVGSVVRQYDSSPRNYYGGYVHYATTDSFNSWAGLTKAYGCAVRCVKVD